MNARFWYWHSAGDGWVKLTLRPGQILTIRSGGPTDEGYSFSADTFEHCGDRVTVEYFTEGRDCDGRSSWHCECECPLDQLAAEDKTCESMPESKGIMAPAWQRVRAGQRDYAAEAMGY
ncbi:MAG: hypothetical protein KGL39_42535 [Patescibacteria group bacterium]|nr:hypothetical protein [Patescibacteria group bacterium]